ncbi:PREDICTED: AAA-ATPase At2g18193-like [Prunus mume]|uniref:AAA-ATPase At2g18193-like n=1 Tax=Prunus mume TaxID=102107 RepID=A0ABM0PMX0_PRUMU|nr:PREDICTED: AAA-ATPase At2g18193-like [Prunus mume]
MVDYYMPTAASASVWLSAYASFAGFMMLVRSMATELMPQPLRSYMYSVFNHLFAPFFSREVTLLFDEHYGMTYNELYEAIEVYLRMKIGPSVRCLRVSKLPRIKAINVSIDRDEELDDTFDGVKMKWCYVVTLEKPRNGSKDEKEKEKHRFELTFHKKHKDKVIDYYLPYVLARAKTLKEEQKTLKLYTNLDYWCGDDDEDNENWGSINLDHPCTFDKLAMDPELKRMIIEDLERFVARREFYSKVGKAWKRGYLLYGPPGTGKSSLVAAMANYLKFNVYDLDLAAIEDNSELKRVMMSTTNRSILVIEDIDCSINLQNRDDDQDKSSKETYSYKKPLTLSGLLNCIDGLRSSCGDERIIIFTTNRREMLDPALLRPGRMDVHIHMSYCTPSGFRVLASNYLGIRDGEDHRLFGEIERLIESTEVTPAQVAEELMKSDDAEVSLGGLVNFLKHNQAERERKKEEEEAKEKKQKKSSRFSLLKKRLKIFSTNS